MDGIECSTYFIDMMLEETDLAKDPALAREQTLDRIIVNSAGYPPGVRDYLDKLITATVDYTLRDLGSIAVEANKARATRWVDEELDLGQVRAQVRRASIDVEELMSVEELSDMLKNGTWMSPKELKDAGCRLSQKEILHIFEEDPEIDTRQEGNYLVGYMTERTIRKVKLKYTRRTGSEPSAKAATPAPTDANAETILIGGTKCVFYQDERYSRQKVADYLKKVDQGVFGNREVIDRAMQYMEADDNDEVLGSALAGLINQVNGGIILISKKKKRKLGSDFGKSPSQIESALKQPEVTAFVRELSPVFNHPYILRKDEEAFYAAMRSLI